MSKSDSSILSAAGNDDTDDDADVSEMIGGIDAIVLSESPAFVLLEYFVLPAHAHLIPAILESNF
jgi:hypothetical protein